MVERDMVEPSPTHFNHNLNGSNVLLLIGKIVIIAVIVLFFVVVLMFLLHVYDRWFWSGVQEATGNPNQSRRRRRRFVFIPAQDPIANMRKGLDPSVLGSIPVLVYSSQDFNDGLECAVCLSELVEGEKARMLPKCNHGFHVDCIDMWFQSHSTCPLCRNPVAPESSESNTPELSENVELSADNLASGFVTETPNLPTNVLYWGDETQVSSGDADLEEGPSSSSSQSSVPPLLSSSATNRHPDGTLVIDIPNQMSSSSLTPSASRFVDDELKSPVITRLMSFKRLLSREKRSSPRSTSSVDIELANLDR